MFDVISMRHAGELEPLKAHLRLGQIDRTILARMIVERQAELLDFLQRDIGAAKKRETAQHTGKRPHERKGGRDITGEGPFIEVTQSWNQEEDETEQSEIEEVTPRLRGDKADFRGHVVLLVNFGRGLNVFRKELAAAAAMELELFDAFGKGAEVAVELVFLFASASQRYKGAAHNEPIAHPAQHHQSGDGSQDLPREISEINGATQQNGHVHS